MQSSAENDDRVITLAREVLLLPAARREEFLRMKCKDQGDLYSEVAEVVEWEERMGGFLSEPLIKYIDLEQDSPPEQVFKPGDAISDRFHIMREVGRGGMGIVYEAFDRKRNQRIAIKCAQPGFGRLLSPELEGALKVRHPNVCLVNEIHTTTLPEHGELDFLTMEYLDGETLDTRLKREGKLSTRDVLLVAGQLCAGVAAAHEAGVLHRDLKPANVILTRNEDGSTRAVITDFGLATEAKLESGLEGGTPRYMAPELLDGKKPSQASDVYALGAILYELATGVPPEIIYSENHKEATGQATKRLRTPQFHAAVIRARSSDPRQRPSADALLKTIQRLPLYRSPIFAMAVLALIASSAALWRPIQDHFRPPDIRLAILPPDVTPELAQVGSDAVQRMGDLIRSLPVAKPSISTISALKVQSANVHTMGDAWRVLHATHAVRVTLRRENDDIVAEETISDLQHNATVGKLTKRYPAKSAGTIPVGLAAELAAALHLPNTVAKESISAAAKAAYATGIYFLNRDRFSFDQAISSFREAASIDPESVLPHAGLAEALIDRYDATGDAKALKEAEAALSTAELLNPDSIKLHLASGRVMQRYGRYEPALLEYGRVQELEPANVEAQLRIGTVFEAELMVDKAAESYLKAIAMDTAYYRSYEELGAFYYHEGHNSEAAEQFRKDVELAPARVDAYVSLGAVLSDLGQYVEAERVLRKSLELRETAAALNNLGAALAYQKRDAEAIEFYRRAVNLRPRSYLYLLNLGDSYRRLSRVSDARDVYKRAKKLVLSELATNARSGYSRASLAYFEARLGDRETSEQDIVQALQLAPADAKVIRRAVLTYATLGRWASALELLGHSGAKLLEEIERHPDMAVFCNDPEFLKLKQAMKQGG